MKNPYGISFIYWLGLAIAKNEEKVVIFDGDEFLLMNFGSLVTVFNQNPKNLIWIVFNNFGCYGSTGNQCSYAENLNILEIAKIVGFENSHDT